MRRSLPLSFLILLLLIVTVMAGCNLILEDSEPCAPPPDTRTVVNFVYDYNMTGDDLFNRHVGSVYLYVFDSKGIYRYRRESHRAEMRGKVDFSMSFDTTEIKPGETYQFVAIASANHIGYEATLETPGFTLQTEMMPGISSIEDYILKLDRDDDGNLDFGVVDYKDAYGNSQKMMDTIWTTKPGEVQTVRIPQFYYTPSAQKQPDYIIDVTIPMMRVTNSITVRLRGALFDENTREDDYNILIHFPHGNGTIDFTGNTHPGKKLYYLPLRKKTVVYGSDGMPTRSDDEPESQKSYGIESVFGVSRLKADDESCLQIRDGITNELIAEIPDFSMFLSSAFDHEMDNQEFLDREYDFNVDIVLDNAGNPLYAILSIEVLGWSVRINFTSF